MMATPSSAPQDDPSPPPCPICFDLGRHPSTPPRVNSCRRIQYIALSARTCQGCRLLHTGLALTAPDLDPNLLVHAVFHAGYPIRVEGDGVDLEFFLAANDDDGNADATVPRFLGRGHRIAPATDASHAAAFARAWLARCRAEHRACRSPSPRGVDDSPRRLLQVLPGTTLRLIENPGPDAEYTALSYCWGDTGRQQQQQRPLTTTRAALASHLQAIPPAALPRTLRDAVALTRALGVPHVWVDALCIVQDDADARDWRAESARMDRIYAGAVVTIAATAASGAGEGFLGRPRAPTGGGGVGVVEWDGRAVHVRRRIGHGVVVPDAGPGADDGAACAHPLLTRGWTFQERLLSRRLLHFLQDELVWECRCVIECECGGASADQAWKTGDVRGSAFSRALAAAAAGSEEETGRALWLGLVEEYSRRVTTRWRDRLPALAGIARMVGARFPGMGGYLAGCWERDAVVSLLWRADGPRRAGWAREGEGGRGAAPAPEPEPTWSWVSFPGPVTWADVSLRGVEEALWRARYVTAVCHADAINPFGGVQGGWLMIDTLLQPCVARRHGGAGDGDGDGWTVEGMPAFPRHDTMEKWLALDRARLFLDGTPDEVGVQNGGAMHYAAVAILEKNRSTLLAVALRRCVKPGPRDGRTGASFAEFEAWDGDTYQFLFFRRVGLVVGETANGLRYHIHHGFPRYLQRQLVIL